MTRRTRIALFAPLVGLLALTVGLMLGSRGLRIAITNHTPSPLVDVVLSYPGGAYRLDRLGPGETVERALRRPLAGMLGGPRAIPLRLVFTQRGTRSVPVEFRCETPRLGRRRVDLTVREDRSRSVVAKGTVVHGHLFVRKLIRNSLDPRIGPRRFYGRRRESIGATVIRRHDRFHEAGELARILAFAPGIALANCPIVTPASLDLTLDYVRALRDCRLVEGVLTAESTPRPSSFELPFRDLVAAQQNLNANFVQLPLLP